MEVKKIESYFSLVLDGVNFMLGARNFEQTTTAYILTDYFKNDKSSEDNFFDFNRDKIFASPGEYNIGSVYFWAIPNINKIVYLFESEEGSLLYWQSHLSQEAIKSIKMLKKGVDACFNLNEIDEEAFKTFKPRLIITNKEPKGMKSDFDKQIGTNFKINLKKVNNSILVLE